MCLRSASLNGCDTRFVNAADINTRFVNAADIDGREITS